MAQAAVGVVPVVIVKPLGQVRVSGLGAGVSVGVRPLVQEDADEALDLSIDSRDIGRRGPVPDAQLSQHPLEALGLEDPSVVGHHRPDTNAHPSVVAQRREQEGRRADSVAYPVG